jgi:multidrug resistance efflux pump
VRAPAAEFARGAEVVYGGRVRAQQEVPVPAPSSGEVAEYLADVGDEVSQGQLLARIRNVELESARERAGEDVERIQARVSELETALMQARLEESRSAADAARGRMEFSRAEKVYQRQQLLFREGATPRLVYEKAQKEYESAQAENENLGALAAAVAGRTAALEKELDNARNLLAGKSAELDQAGQDLRATEVLSPVDGIVVARRGGPGEPVNPAIPDLLRIAVDLGALEVVFDMPPDVARRLPRGYPVQVILAETGGEPLAGAVESVRAGEVVAAFASPNPAIRPGLTARVRFKLP